LLSKRSFGHWAAGGLLLVPVLALAACGGSNKASKPTKVAISITQAGKSTKYTVPKSIKGGLVELTVSNQAKGPHGAQLVKIEGNHTTQEALKVVNSNSPKTPSWVRGEGGLGGVGPGLSVKATLNLPAGKYLVTDSGGPGSSGPPGYSSFTVTKGKDGDLPSTPTTVTGAEKGKDKFAWDISGSALKAGRNTVTFKAEGKNSIHLLGAFRVTGNPSQAQIIKALKSSDNGPPPKFVDTSSFYATAVLDGGKSQTTPLPIKQTGKWVLFCPLTDRDGGKPHFEEGMLKVVDVK
jgi:hypothetical protein